jgi:hypothetical protein
MDTFTDLYKRAAKFCGVNPRNIPADLLIDLKRDVNRGIAKIYTTSRVGYTQKTLTSNLVANQQYYQTAPDCIRPTTIQVVAQGLFATLPLQEVPTIAKWNEINVWPQLSFPWPTYYFVRGHNQVGLWPTPGAAQAGGLIITYEALPPEMAIDDISSTVNSYTTANPSTPVTADVTNDSNLVSFSEPIINVPCNNLYFMTTDGTDGHTYLVSSITDASHIVLGQNFQLPGQTSATAQFRIGQMEDLPDMVQLAGAYNAAAQFYAGRKDTQTEQDYLALFQGCLDDFRESFSTRSTSRVSSDMGVSGMNAWDYMGIGPVSPGY